MRKLVFAIFLFNSSIAFGQSEYIDPITIKNDGTCKRLNSSDRSHHSQNVIPGLKLTFWDSAFTKIKTQVTISNWQMNGTFKSFNEKGFLTKMGNFKNSLEDGFFYYWNDEGVLLKKEKYIEGILKKTIKYK